MTENRTVLIAIIVAALAVVIPALAGAANSGDFVSGVAIGSTYAGTSAPSDGLIVKGNVGIGTTNPTDVLVVSGAIFSTASRTVGIANSLNIDYDGSTFARIIGNGPNASTKGNVELAVSSSDSAMGSACTPQCSATQR